MQLATLIVAFAISMGAQDLPRHEKPSTNTPSTSAQPSPDNAYTDSNVKPNPQDANHRSNAVNTSSGLEKDQSAMQKSAPANQLDANQADRRIKAQTSPRREVRSSAWALLWIGVVALAVLILFAARRPRRRIVARRRDVMDRGNLLNREDMLDRREAVNRRDEDIHRAA
jgi:uncharacterized membrane protein